MSLLNIMTAIDDLNSVVDKKTDEIAKMIAKEALVSSFEMSDIQKMFKNIPTETALVIMYKALSIISKSTGVNSTPNNTPPRRSNRSLFS